MSPAEKIRYRNMEDFGFGPNVMKKTKICAKCGRMAEANARTCPECGEIVEVFTRKGRVVSESACDCGFIFREEEQVFTRQARKG